MVSNLLFSFIFSGVTSRRGPDPLNPIKERKGPEQIILDIGTKDFVARLYQSFKENFSSKHEKRPKLVSGLDGIFSLKRLSEAI